MNILSDWNDCPNNMMMMTMRRSQEKPQKAHSIHILSLYLRKERRRRRRRQRLLYSTTAISISPLSPYTLELLLVLISLHLCTMDSMRLFLFFRHTGSSLTNKCFLSIFSFPVSSSSSESSLFSCHQNSPDYFFSRKERRTTTSHLGCEDFHFINWLSTHPV